MDKRNFVYNYIPLKSDFDNLQNDVEGGIKDVASAVAGKGILSGLVVSIAGSDATVTSGVAYDGQGNRIAPRSDLVVSIGGITRPLQGRYKWVTLALRYETKDEGEIIDGNNKKWPARLLDSHSSLLLDGAEGTASAITKPALLDWQVPLLDIRVDHSSPWENLVTSTERRPSLIPVADVSSRITKLQTDLEAAFPVGTIWMYDGAGWQDNVTLPGWYACIPANEDGGSAGLSHGITSMVDRFVMGRAVAGDGAIGGSNSYRLTAAQLPAHTHTINHDHPTFNSGNQRQNHRHQVALYAESGGSHQHSLGFTTGGQSSGGTLRGTGYRTTAAVSFWISTSNTGFHGHNVRGWTGWISSGHNHAIDIPAFAGNSGSTGLGVAVDNRPAFYSLVFIRKCV